MSNTARGGWWVPECNRYRYRYWDNNKQQQRKSPAERMKVFADEESSS